MIVIEKHKSKGLDFDLTTVKMTAKDLIALTFSATETTFIADDHPLNNSSTPVDELIEIIRRLSNG